MAIICSLCLFVYLLSVPVFGSTLEKSQYKVLKEKMVKETFRQHHAVSPIQCATYCKASTSSGEPCFSATYDNVHKKCHLSKDNESDTIAANGDGMKTLLFESLQILKTCPALSAPSRGSVIVNGNEAIYFCDEGYTTNGDVDRFCENGVWSGVTPRCDPQIEGPPMSLTSPAPAGNPDNIATPPNEGQHSGRPRDCNDIGDRGSHPTGTYIIYPNTYNRVDVFCDFQDSDGPWTVIQRRIDDSVDFYRPYKAYQDGFGDITGNFWLGLDVISAMTLLNDKDYTLRVVIYDPVEDSAPRFAVYSQFQVMNASEDYRLDVGGYSGTAGDSLTYHNGRPFSTYDNSHDVNGTNCAEECLGAWWYDYCQHSNLNGKYGESRSYKGINWDTMTGNERSAIFVSMELKGNKE